MELRLENGAVAGTAAVECRGEDTVFTVTARLDDGLWRIIARGSAGELTLGVLEGGEHTLRRRFSSALTDRLGQVESVTARRSAITRMESEWREACGADVPRLPSLPPGALCRSRGTGHIIAIPWRQGEPFPMTEMFVWPGWGPWRAAPGFSTRSTEKESLFFKKNELFFQKPLPYLVVMWYNTHKSAALCGGRVWIER